MNKKAMKKLKSAFSEKSAILENARQTLKQEFFGIDNIIDELIENVSAWFALNEIQERPMVINLWGLTGVGKSALINRLVELLQYENLYYRFDLGEKDSRLSFKDGLQELCENKEDTPMIISLDEFQHSRTVIDGNGPARREVEKDKNRSIWELLDSGKIKYIDWMKGLWSLGNYIGKLFRLSKAGVWVEENKIRTGKKIFCREMDEEYSPRKEVLVIPERYYPDILETVGEKYGLHLLRDVEKFVRTLDFEQIISLLKEVYRKAQKPSVKSFHKSLIFVIGNLDEAYKINGEFSAEIGANDFHKISKKITIPEIKYALRERFRDEQIARLGNIHIIYPALDKHAYECIIRNELKKISLTMQSSLHIDFQFDKSVEEALYSEGVYPTQGARPLLTTINHHLNNKLIFFIQEILTADTQPDSMCFEVEDNHLKCNYWKDGEIYHSTVKELNFHLKKLRHNKKDEQQALTAVHESGHVVLSALLLQTVPEYVYSVTSSHNNSGFIFCTYDDIIKTRSNILDFTAMKLGGLAAEELVFGEDNLSTGCESDIRSATVQIISVLKNEGFGKTPIYYSNGPHSERLFYHQINSVEQEAKELIEKAKTRAKEVLQKEQKLLLILSDYLSQNTCIRKKELQQIIATHATSDDWKQNNTYFFRNRLNEALHETLQPNEENGHRKAHQLSVITARGSEKKRVGE